ncbi:MAG: hypothetical protein II857_02870 [Selenomonadaceae bacterium]|nr:hypothetical protein [Selenomonadaceae bacterium]
MADEKILKDKGLKDEKILKDELLSDEQLEQIAGGRKMHMIEQNQETDTAQNIFPNQLIAKKPL